MEWWQALLLGIVEGITEYLPVSSTGHLVLTQRLLGLPESAASNAYAICIQAGAIVAVLSLYGRHVQQMGRGVLGQDPAGAKLLQCLIIAFLPAAVLGVLFDDLIESYLFGLKPIVAAWLVGGIAILALPQTRHFNRTQTGFSIGTLTWQRSFTIGLIQCLAMWPGTSRSLVTILAGLFMGLSVAAAVEFSFLLGVVTLGAATAYKGLQSAHVMFETYGVQSIIIGFVASWVSAMLAVRWLVTYLKRHGLRIFAYWRIGLAMIVAALLVGGVLPA